MRLEVRGICDGRDRALFPEKKELIFGARGGNLWALMAMNSGDNHENDDADLYFGVDVQCGSISGLRGAAADDRDQAFGGGGMAE